MTKEFENFKNELNLLNQTEERNRILKIENFKNQIEHDKKILKESGIIELFQNIRDNQIVSSEETVRKPVYKKTFFGSSRDIDHYEYTKIKKPAEIIFSDNYSSNYDYSKCLNKKKNTISVALIFNITRTSDDFGGGGSCQCVRVDVENSHLNLFIMNDQKLVLSQIKNGELEKNIAWAINNPISASYGASLSEIIDNNW